VCQVEISAVPKQTGLVAPGLWGEKGTGQPTESGRGILGGSVGKSDIQTWCESGYQVKMCKNATHIEVELREATKERVCEITRPFI